MSDYLKESIGQIHSPVCPAQAEILAGLAKGKRVLEIGTGSGVSTRAMAKTAIQVATFEVSQRVRDMVWPTLPKNVMPYDRRHEGLRQGGNGFGLVFIDGDHDYPAVVADIKEVAPLMSRYGIWVFHDMQQENSVKAVTENALRFMPLDKVVGENATMWVCQVQP